MWSYLICVNSEIEADIITGLLDEAQIPTQKKYPGGLKASYGIINGVEVWVPSDSLEQAQELLITPPQNSESSTATAEESVNELNTFETDSKTLSFNWLSKVIVISCILILFVLIYGLLSGETSY